jgi:F-type H+-transporting ATPase subunit delta
VRDPRLGRRYAEALYSAASDQGLVPEVVVASKDVLLPLTEDSTFLGFWQGHQVPALKKQEVVEEVFKDLPAPLRQFLRLLLTKNREEVLFDALTALFDINDRERGTVCATLTTAIEMDEANLEAFKALLIKKTDGGEVIFEQKIDTNIIAGFILRFGDKIIDASVARSISEIRRRMSA